MRHSMQSVLLVPLFFLVFLCSLGSSCDEGAKSEAASDGREKSAPAARIERLAQVDLGALTDAERRRWADLVNEILSPCGEPVSVAQCVSESRKCEACVPAARYLVRLVGEGLDSSEIREHFGSRFDPKRKVAIDISDAPLRGSPMASIGIIEFSDFA